MGSLPLLPYSSMFANCFLWLTYGVLKGEIKIWGTNGVGLLFAVYYILRFVRYAPAKSATLPGSIRQHVNFNLAVVVGTTLILFFPLSDPTDFIGNLGVLFCVAMFGSPLAALKTVIQTKSAKSIPLPFTLATVLNCFLWSVFGLLEMKDVNIYLPNLLGLACGMGQVALKLLYGDGTGAKVTREMDLLV